jgi:hypothetical protein
MYPEMPSLGSFLAKDKDIEVIFIQNNLLVPFLYELCYLLKTLFTYQTKDYPVKAFFRALLISTFSFGNKGNFVKSLLISAN